MTFDEFMELTLSTFPLAEVGEDNDGQLVIYTGLRTVVNGEYVKEVQ